MSNALNVNTVVQVAVSLAAQAAQQQNFGNMLILGDSAVIDTTQRLRLYTSVSQVAQDFPTNAPEYLAAVVFFAQSPSPGQLYLGRWASTATSGVLQGGPLSSTAQTLSNFTAVVSGGLNVTIDATPVTLSGVNLSGATSLAQVAAIIASALGSHGTCTWNPNQGNFSITSATTGTNSAVSFATVGTGTDLSSLMGLQVANSGSYLVNGIAAETIETAVTILDQNSNLWYGLAIASTVAVADVDTVKVAQYIEATSANAHLFAVTTQEGGALLASSTTDVAYLLNNATLNRTFCQYSSTSPYAAVSLLAVLAGINYRGQNTALTLMFKNEPTITPENLTASQAAALQSKNCNVYVNYNNHTAITQWGTSASGQYVDTIAGMDWLAKAIQDAIFNVLITAPKIPQTDPGVDQIISTTNGVLSLARTNGLVAPGVWTGPAVGSLANGQTLTLGYYTYAPSVATQTAAQRASRQSPVLQACIKLAGAIHDVSAILTVNQ